MKIPVIKGTIDRRILVNYRIQPEIMAKQLPRPFRPKLIHGFAMGGICLIRLKHIRPSFVPWQIGIGSENAAHRIAVQWDSDQGIREGVFIPRRDTNSFLNSFAGGRIFPGVHHRASFYVQESDTDFQIQLQSEDRVTQVHVTGRIGSDLPRQSIFGSLNQASEFFENGSLGYSATRNQNHFDGLELQCVNWQLEPLDVSHLKSSFFDDTDRFPKGSIEFDCGLLMRNIQHQWHGQGELVCPQ
jgi:hypothetical protein